MHGFHRAGRKAANARLMARGVFVEGEVLESRVEGDRFRCTTVTFSFVPSGATTPLSATRKLDGA